MGDDVIDVVDSMNMQLRQQRFELGVLGGEDAEVFQDSWSRVEEDSCGPQDDDMCFERGCVQARGSGV